MPPPEVVIERLDHRHDRAPFDCGQQSLNDWLRLRASTGHTGRTTALMDALRRQYRLMRTFRNRPSWGPLRWFSVPDLFAQLERNRGLVTELVGAVS